MAWAAEREGGGRGFGFTGGHDHWNWGDPNFRKVVLNAIVWCAHGEVPKDGVERQAGDARTTARSEPGRAGARQLQPRGDSQEVQAAGGRAAQKPKQPSGEAAAAKPAA